METSKSSPVSYINQQDIYEALNKKADLVNGKVPNSQGGVSTIDEVLANGGSLSEERVIQINGNNLSIRNGTDLVFSILPANGVFRFLTPAGIVFELSDDSNKIQITAPAIVINGKLRIEGLPEFANNAAAIAGGLAVNDLYFTGVSGDGIVKFVLA